MKRYSYILIIASLLALLVFAGCGETVPTGGNTIFYIDRDVTSLVEKNVSFTSNDLNTTGMIEECIRLLDAEVEDVGAQPALLADLTITDYELSHNTLYLHFSEDYNALDSAAQLLCRAAVVKTMVQITDVDAVYFYVGDVPLTDVNGNIVGILTADSFVENPGSQINYTDTTTLTLYFTDKEGMELIPEIQTLHYISSISMEKLVVERLIAGPETDGLVATVPSATKIISVSTMDGTCYVNLDDGFTAQNYDVSEEVVIYSIVDSLFALNDGIGRVMITVNGESNITYRESFSLDQFFTKNLDLIQDASDEETREAEVKLTGE